MPADFVIADLSTSSVTKDYTLPDSVEIVLKAVTASFDGSGASGQYVGMVDIISPAGLVVARCPCTTTLAAGASADISWFRLGKRQSTTSSLTPYESLALGSPLLRAYYKLDDRATTTMKDSGPLGFDGTYHGSPTLGQPALADGYSVLFSAASSQWGGRTDLPGFGPTGPQAFACWFKGTTVPASAGQLVCSDDNSFRYGQLRIENTGKVGYIVFDAGNTNVSQIVSSNVVTDGSRHMIVGTWDSGQLQRIMVDNVVVASTTTALVGQSQSIKNITVGARDLGLQTEFLTGTVDEAMVFNGCPPDSYFTNLYNAGLLA